MSAKKVLGEESRMKNDWIHGKTYREIEERQRLNKKIGCTACPHEGEPLLHMQ